MSTYEFINIGSRPTVSTPIASSSTKGQVSPMETLIPQTPGQNNVPGHAVNIEGINMSDSNPNGSYIQNAINMHVHFLFSNVARLVTI